MDLLMIMLTGCGMSVYFLYFCKLHLKKYDNIIIIIIMDKVFPAPNAHQLLITFHVFIIKLCCTVIPFKFTLEN